MKYNLYVEDVSVEAVFNKHGGVEGVKRFLSSDVVVVERNMLAASSQSDNGGISRYLSGLNTELFIADWREFYRQVHSMDLDPTNLVKRLPPIMSGFNWGALVFKGATPQRAYEMAASMFPCWKWCGDQSLDKVIDFDKEARRTEEPYAVWCEDSVEPPKRLADTSAIQIAEKQINTLGLTEAELLHQWFYWKSSGKNLDVKNWTLCSASRSSDGRVPGVNWYGYYSRLYVYRWSPCDARDSLRSREVVSLAA